MTTSTNLLLKNIEALKQAAAQGVQVVREMVGRQTDPDLALYEGLQPNDFKRMIGEYGQPEVERYIRHMEAQRLRGGQRG